VYDLHFIEWITKLKPYINLIDVHSQLNHNKDAKDGVFVKGASSLWLYQSSPPLVTSFHDSTQLIHVQVELVEQKKRPNR